MANMTNYERIKNMSIEEMSYIFAMVKLNTVKELYPEIELENNMIEEQCEICFNWLNSEVDNG